MPKTASEEFTIDYDRENKDFHHVTWQTCSVPIAEKMGLSLQAAFAACLLTNTIISPLARPPSSTCCAHGRSHRNQAGLERKDSKACRIFACMALCNIATAAGIFQRSLCDGAHGASHFRWRFEHKWPAEISPTYFRSRYLKGGCRVYLRIFSVSRMWDLSASFPLTPLAPSWFPVGSQLVPCRADCASTLNLSKRRDRIQR